MNIGLIRKNIFVFSTGEIVSRILNFFALVYVARILFVSDFGEINLAIVLVSYFTILLGFIHDDIATKEIASGELNEIDYRNNVLSLRLIISVLLYAMLIIFVLSFIRNDSVRFFAIVYGLSIISTGVYTNWFFRGKEKFLPISIGLVISSLLNLVSVFLFINNSADSNIAIWIITLKEILNSIILFVFYLTKKPTIKFSLNVAIAKNLFKQSYPLALSALLLLMNFNIDQLMLGIMTNSAEVGYYSASVKFIFLAFIPASIIYQTFYPQMSKASSGTGNLRQLLQNYSKVLFACGLIFTILGYSFSKTIIEITYGVNYHYSITLLKILMLSLFLGYFNRVYGNPLIAIGKQNQYLTAIIVGVLVNIFVNLLLIPKLYSVGSAYASVLSELSVFIILLYIHKKNFGNLYLNSLVKSVVLGVILIVTVYILQYNEVSNSLIFILIIILLIPMMDWIRKILFNKNS